MGSKMLIDASHPEETRVVVLKGNRIEEFDFESAARRQLKGNIYLAKVTRVEPSLQAAFVEYGGNRHGFLAFSEIHPDYYQIPLADRLALLQAEEEEHAREAEDEDDEGEGSGRRRRGRDRGRGGRRASRGEENTDGGVEEISEPEYAEDAYAAGDDSFAGDHGPETNEGESPESHVLDVSSELTGGEAVEHHDEADDDGDDTPPRAAPMSASHDDPSLSEPVGAGSEPSEPEARIEARLAEPAAGPPDEAGMEAAAPAPTVQHGIPGELGNGVEEVGEDPDAVRVEEIGAEDALEEVPQRRRKVQRKQYTIQEVIKRRQVILVQVVKEERGNKGAALTTYLSLAGRYCVLMPNTARGGGISRKITESGDRRRLKEMVKEIEVPQGMGLIVRTAGAQRTKTEIKRDYDYLLRLWESVRDLTLKSQAPALVYEEGSLVKRAIRDLYTKDVDEVIVEGDEAYREVKDFMKMLMPSHARNVKPYKDSRPLFSRWQAESQLDGLYSPTVTLPSGGYMVINQTEALVSVDINSGKATREHNIEDTAYKTNLEAADEIARQLRLRDLAGLVVIDFIDMEEKRNNRNVERRLKDALKNDRARIQVGHISHFGLLEMSRQRLRPGLLEGSSRSCPHCEGRGVVRSVSSCGLSVLRAVEEQLIARKPENLTVKCPREIAFYILNEKRDNLLSIETAYGISVFITPSDELKGSQALIERAPERNIPPRRVMAAPVRIDSAFEEEDEENGQTEAEAEVEIEAENGAGEAGEERQSGNSEREGGDREGGRRRRRRGRRGGRGRDEQQLQNGRGDDVPGLGEQPDFDSQDDRETGGNQTEAGGGSAVAEAGGEEPSEDGERPRRGRGRRDRWGRDRGERPRRDERPETGAEAGGTSGAEAGGTSGAEDSAADESVVSAPGPAPATPPAPVTTADAVAEASAPAETPRRWQPPAPTVTPASAERKSGWWSKR
ncbi:Rne/Rng family ribonuclease [Aestuariivirga sp.]|uniref:Rne/Rng family ribonuclease n=1 Tax=Aestuariivirga sp. TaxID=2650926 RepID=UPI0025B93521|nr:Rne/Rng family ribonuclease [Aestuariivirga sp.]MCA3555156.1 Rne/Rng family ribonuclease [Aestuariivirga sp.]